MEMAGPGRIGTHRKNFLLYIMLIRPVLVKQELVEARTNSRKTIEYVAPELKRLDGALKILEEQSSSKREEIIKLQ